MAASKLTIVGSPPERITVAQDVQKAAHAINTMAGRLVSAVGRPWTTEPQIAATADECLVIAEQALALARMLRKGGA